MHDQEQSAAVRGKETVLGDCCEKIKVRNPSVLEPRVGVVPRSLLLQAWASLYCGEGRGAQLYLWKALLLSTEELRENGVGEEANAGSWLLPRLQKVLVKELSWVKTNSKTQNTLKPSEGNMTPHQTAHTWPVMDCSQNTFSLLKKRRKKLI